VTADVRKQESKNLKQEAHKAHEEDSAGQREWGINDRDHGVTTLSIGKR
jgi:hypothetical protein